MKITFVKKIKEDGTLCRKCEEVSERLETHDEMKFIDQVVFADMRDPDSEGSKLAEQYDVTIAPFFLVENDGMVTVYKTYLALKKKVFEKTPDQADVDIEEKRKPADDFLYYV